MTAIIRTRRARAGSAWRGSPRVRADGASPIGDRIDAIDQMLVELRHSME
jgi:hypothetical protein